MVRQTFFRKTLWTSLLVLVPLLGGLCGYADSTPAVSLDLVRETPMEIPKKVGLPASFDSASAVMPFLTLKEDDLGIHMEALRRAYHSLGLTERKKLVDTLYTRYQGQPKNEIYYFDHGYTQWLFQQNKTALFFLRKANDALHTPYTCLAYAMAQAEVDLTEEHSAPDQVTTRKMDVGYKLNDAVVADAEHHIPGFWPSFVQVLKKLEPVAAYNDIVFRDYSPTYVPYGNKTLPKAVLDAKGNPISFEYKSDKGRISIDNTENNPLGATALSALQETVPKPGLTAKAASTHNESPCVFTPVSSAALPNRMLTQRLLPGNTVGDYYRIRFYKRDPKGYRVVATNAQDFILADFPSTQGASIIEDLEDDGQYELVVRQYRDNPFKPVEVYRLTPNCGYQLDEKIQSYFE